MNYIKKIASLILVSILLVSSINTYYAAEFNGDDFYSYVNADLIAKYETPSNDDNNSISAYVEIMAQKNEDKIEEIAKKIANDEIILDQEISHNADITTAFLKKIYDKDNFDFFTQKFKDKGFSSHRLSTWYTICPVLMSMVNMDIITHIIHTDPRSKKIVENIDEIEAKARKAMDLYIDSMDITDETKQSMKKTINNTRIFYCGIKHSFDTYYNDYKKEIDLLSYINSDNEIFFNGLHDIPEVFYDTNIVPTLNALIYEPNCSSLFLNFNIFVYPAMFLCPEPNDESLSLENFMLMVLCHEIGHNWSTRYIEKTYESSFKLDSQSCKTQKEYENLCKALDNQKSHLLVDICSEDREKLESHAQDIIDAFNNIDTKLYYDDQHNEKVLVDGLSVFSETVADNFAFNSIIAFAKHEHQDPFPIFRSFARYNWGICNLNDFKLNPYPPSIYRINIGLKLCSKFNEWAQQQN